MISLNRFCWLISLSALLSCAVYGYSIPDSNSSTTDQEFFWFTNEDGEVFKAFLKGGPPPETLESVADKMEFWLYKNGTGRGVLIDPKCTEWLDTYAPAAPLVIYSHGYCSSHSGSFGETHRSGITHVNETTNVIFLNWEKLAKTKSYGTAAANVDPVGKYTAELINLLVEKNLTSLSKIHFVGHSLGCHVANHVANNVRGGKMARITALDPASFLFERKSDEERIDPTDAAFVSVIHTAMGTFPSGLAFVEPRGHVDFYPNSGKDQPGCGYNIFYICSHSRANEFFAESVANTSAFVACKCKDWNEFKDGTCLLDLDDQEVMGWGTNVSARGIYYLRTNPHSPYGQGRCSGEGTHKNHSVGSILVCFISAMWIFLTRNTFFGDFKM